MTANEIRKAILGMPIMVNAPDLAKTLEQKWEYSHYIHGEVAFQAGETAGLAEDMCFDIAASLEIVWAAILMIDDIVDCDEVRYHMPSAWKHNGYDSATMQINLGMLEGFLLLADYDIRDLMIKASHETLLAMNRINEMSVETLLDDMECEYCRLGALSSFAVAWPWPNDKAIWKIAELETCAGQLVNDCNDCFGRKAKRRDYSDLRNHQATLLLGIINQYYDAANLTARIQESDATDCATIAEDLLKLIQSDPSILLNTFRLWMDEAIDLANLIEKQSIRASAVSRVCANKSAWEKKLQRLIGVEL